MKFRLPVLSRAAERGDEMVIKLLLENGAGPDFEDEFGCHEPLREDQRGLFISGRLRDYRSSGQNPNI